MNFLAHSFLSGDNDDIHFGNFIGDVIKGNQFENFSGNVRLGILLHREIDTFTDSHEVYLQSKRKFYEQFPKVSGIITDILYDHILCREWEKHADQLLDNFIKTTYQRIDARKNDLPVKLMPVYHHMRENDWFTRYRSIEGTTLSLSQIGNRIGYKGLDQSMDVFIENETAFVGEFNVFFKEIQEFCQTFINEKKEAE